MQQKRAIFRVLERLRIGPQQARAEALGSVDRASWYNRVNKNLFDAHSWHISSISTCFGRI